MIWLIGNTGMLGSEVEILLNKTQLNYVTSDIECDITEYKNLENFSARKNISWIINCSAYTAVDKAEDEPEISQKINSHGVANIAKIAREKNAKLIHISTDYVFDGKKNTEYSENDPVNPFGIYGKTKAEGEKKIHTTFSNYYIIRTAWLFGKHGQNFVSTMLNLFKNKENIGVVADQWGSPTYAPHLAQAIISFVKKEDTAFGIYHFSNEGKTSWFSFAKEIYKQGQKINLVKSYCEIKPLTTAEYPTKAKRPANTYLCKDKIRKTLGIDIKSWHEALAEYLNEIEEDYE